MVAVVDIPGNGVTPSYTTNPGGLPTPAAPSNIATPPESIAPPPESVDPAASSNSNGNGLSSGAIAGIAVGSVCALLLSVGLGVFLYRRSQNTKKAVAVGSQSQATLEK